MVMSASKDSFTSVWEKVTDIGGSDTQMACYLYLLHIWIKLTNADTEIMLRLYNIVWVLVAAWFLRKEPKILLILMISPFFIYYINELRPYIMQIAAACGISIFLYKKSLGAKQGYIQGFGLLFLLCTTSLTSVIWAIGFFSAWAVLEGRNFWSRKLFYAAAWWSVPFIGLGSYYLYTLLIGARATHIQSNGLVNIGASIYELFGLTGLGPARCELRLCTHLSDIVGQNGLLLALVGGLITGIVLLLGLNAWRKRASNVILVSLLALLIFPLSVFLYSSAMMSFRFSGRHFAPILPLICIIISMGLRWHKKALTHSILSTAFVLIWLTSNLYIRFDSTYAREDYRGAIEYCKTKQNNGEIVLLLCNGSGKEYYGWDDNIDPQNWGQCQSIVVSRPDNYANIVKQIELSGTYHKRYLCPAFWTYEANK